MKSIIFFNLLFSFAMMTSQSVEASLAADPTPADECTQFIRTLSSDFKTDRISVPEDWSRPRGRKISIFYYYRPAVSGTPIVFFHGGPGYTSHEKLLEILDREKAYGLTLPMVFFDQRGNGCSTNYPVSVDLASAARLAQYGPDAIARDAEAIRRKLFANHPWKILAQSFGGDISTWYIDLFPTKVTAAFNHGTLFTRDMDDYNLQRARAQREVTERYFDKFPGDRAQAELIRQKIPGTKCFSRDSNGIAIKICGAVILDGANNWIGYGKWDEFHTILGKLLAADGSLDNAVLASYADDVFDIYVANNLSEEVINWQEGAQPTDALGARLVIKQLTKHGEDPASWTFDENRLIAAIANPLLDDWAVRVSKVTSLRRPFGARIKLLYETLKNHPQLPYYLYFGADDTFCPVTAASREIARFKPLPNFHPQIVPGHGHDTWYGVPDFWIEMLKN